MTRAIAWYLLFLLSVVLALIEEVLDVQATLDWLEAEGVGDRVVRLGMSMGAATLSFLDSALSRHP